MRRLLPLLALVLIVTLFGRSAPARTLASGARPLPGTTPLRVAFDLGRDGLTTRDPMTGQLQGVEVDLARALATQLGRTFVPVAYTTGSVEGLRIYEGIKTQEWDIAFLPVDPQYAKLVDFSTAYIDVESSYLVAPGSPIADVTEIDRPGVRVAVQDGSTADRFLTQNLKQAQIQRADNLADAVYFMQRRSTDAIAADRPTLLRLTRLIPGSRVLSGHFLISRQAIAVPKGHGFLLAPITSFVEQVKADGMVDREIQTSGNSAVRVSAPAATGP